MIQQIKKKNIAVLLIFFCILSGALNQVFATDVNGETPIERVSGIFEGNGNKYAFFISNYSWSEAESYCEKLGGHLVTITSKEEQDFCTKLCEGYYELHYNVWIGGYRENGIWKWVTGEAFSYSNWDDGQPDNCEGMENYINMWRQYSCRWNDINNSYSELSYIGCFICEFESCVTTKKSQYYLRITDEDTGGAINGAKVEVDEKTYTTDSTGTVTVLNSNGPLASLIVSCTGYNSKQIYFPDLKQNSCNTISLTHSSNNSIIQLDLGSETIHGPTIGVGDWQFPVFQSNIGFKILGVEGKEQKTYDDNGNLEKISIIYGVNDDYLKDKEYDKSLQGLKNFYNLVGTSNVEASENAYKTIKNKLKKESGLTIGADIDGSFCGFIEYNYKNGTMVSSYSGFIIAGKTSSKLKYRIKATCDIVYIKLNLSGEPKAKLQIVSTNITDPQLLANFNLNFELKVGIGAGTDYILSLEGGVDGKLTNNILLDGINDDKLEKILTVKANAGIYWKAVAFTLFEYSGNTTLAEAQLFPEENEFSTQSIADISDYNDYILPSRDYLYTMSTQSVDSNNAEYYESNIYPYGAPSLVSLEDGRIMALWLQDDSSRTSANRTKLVYSIRDTKGSWSEPQAVYDSGKADLEPKVVSVGNQVFVLWKNGTEVFSDDITLTEMASKMNLVYSAFDGSTFNEPTIVNTAGNSKTQILSGIDVSDGKIMISWIENSNNDIYLTAGTNALFTRTCENNVWGEINLLDSDLGVATAMLPDASTESVFYVKDMDGNLSTEEDTHIYMAMPENTSDIGLGDGLCRRDGTLYCFTEDILSTVTASGITGIGTTCSYNFDVINQNGIKSILYEVNNGYKNELYITSQTSDGWTTPVAYTALDSFIRYFDAEVSSDGTLLVAMDQVVVNEDFDGSTGSPYGNTDFVITGEKNDYDLSVENTVYYDLTSVEAGKVLPISIVVSNNGLTDVDALDYTWKNSDGNVIETGTIEQTIASGETAEINLNYTIPEIAETTQLTLTVMPSGLTSDSTDDNTAILEYGYADLALSNTNLTKNTDSSGTITATVTNNGQIKSENSIVKAYLNNSDGEVLQSKVVGNLAAGESQEISLELTKTQMIWDNECDGKLILLQAETETTESAYSNNAETVWAEPVLAESISIDQTEISMQVGETAEINATMDPVDSVNVLHWVSSDTTIAEVDENGIVTAISDGIAHITVITGNLSKTCVVSVEKVVLKGDINQDGSLTIEDANLAKRIAMKTATESEYTTEGFNAGDLDGNGKITINEARKIKRTVLTGIEL